MITHRLYLNEQIFGIHSEKRNAAICFSGISFSKEFQALCVNGLTDYDPLEKPQCLPLCRYDKDGSRVDNITDWGLRQFVRHYRDESIRKEDIFHYTYAVLHNPAYRRKYEINLKRQFPRLPFYKDFRKWAKWGSTSITKAWNPAI